ncbi:MAG: hypothetical protein ACYDCC_02480 [Actinomycetota bacterium]
MELACAHVLRRVLYVHDVAGRKKSVFLPLLLAIIGGIVGSAGAITLFGKGTYTINPFVVSFKVKVASRGTTTFALDNPKLPRQGTATAETHKGYLAATVSIVDVDPKALATSTLPVCAPSCKDTPLDATSPQSIGHYLAANGQAAIRSFGIKVGIIAFAGSFVLALGGSMFNLKRAVIGTLVGVLAIGALAFIAKQTYDINKFGTTSFGTSSSSP